ncbi:MAG: hypothetical protein QME66_09850 [Candidatus Eisenbacteria bacterium]|nr:hypothetical protein [Candidatus Eisenbacteria bacterium]
MPRGLLSAVALVLPAIILLAAVSYGQESNQGGFTHPPTSLLLNLSYSNTAFTQNGSVGISIGKFLYENLELALGARAFGIENSEYSYDPVTMSPKETNTSTTFISGSVALNLHLVSPNLLEKRLSPYVGLEGGYTLMKSYTSSYDSEEPSWLWGGTVGAVYYVSKTWAVDGGWRFTFQRRPTEFGKTAVVDESSANVGIRTFF